MAAAHCAHQALDSRQRRVPRSRRSCVRAAPCAMQNFRAPGCVCRDGVTGGSVTGRARCERGARVILMHARHGLRARCGDISVKYRGGVPSL
eukprot:6447970-Prymnesium_polylepis.4